MINATMVLDLQYGSTGKGLIAGWLAKRRAFDTAVCAFATNAGHTYIDKSRDINMMTQQLPTAISSPTVENVLLGPGAAINAEVLKGELERYAHMMVGKRLMIHPHAVVVDDSHVNQELRGGMTKIGSTAKGVGAAYIERMKRSPDDPNIAANRFAGTDLAQYVVNMDDYRQAIIESSDIIIEGAQGFSLSMYHGQYPYTTSRDVTPWQVGADCGLPFSMASSIEIVGTLRTFPIRVNNRDGSSGPCYPDQRELTWEEVGVAPESTTVTKLPRRIFTFSHMQLEEALFHCEGLKTRLFLNFANYYEAKGLKQLIEEIGSYANIEWIGYGPDDSDVKIA